jgi:hypothetical protein
LELALPVPKPLYTELFLRLEARGIAQMIRAGLYRPVHVKTLRSQKLRMLLTHRKLLQSKAHTEIRGGTEWTLTRMRL